MICLQISSSSQTTSCSIQSYFVSNPSCINFSVDACNGPQIDDEVSRWVIWKHLSGSLLMAGNRKPFVLVPVTASTDVSTVKFQMTSLKKKHWRRSCNCFQYCSIIIYNFHKAFQIQFRKYFKMRTDHTHLFLFILHLRFKRSACIIKNGYAYAYMHLRWEFAERLRR